MKSSCEYKLKILYILKFLREETDESHYLTMADIISRLSSVGISAERKSIYDDIAALVRFGIPVESSRGCQSGYYIADRDFELPELKLLVDAVQSSKFITRQKSTALIKKISSLTSRYEADKLKRQVHMSNRIKTMNESIYYNVDIIHTAISENVQLQFKYFEWTPLKEKELRHNGKSYQVSPWALCWENENYYMLAFDSNAGLIKHYRVDKMIRISYTEQKRQGEQLFKSIDMSQYSNKLFGMFGGVEESVTLMCDNTLSGVIIDRFGDEVSIFPHETFFYAAVSVIISANFLSWVTQFGNRMSIISPKAVVNKAASLLEEALEAYK